MKLRIIVSLFFGSLFVYVIARGVNADDLLSAMTAMDPWPLIPFLVLVMIYHGLRVVRWRLLLLPDFPIAYPSLFRINMIGFMAINLFPIRLGEFVRPYVLTEREGVPFGAGMATVLIERLLDFLAMLVILLVVVFFVDLPTKEMVIGEKTYDLLSVVQNVFLVVAVPAISGLVGLMLLEEWMYKLMHATWGRFLPHVASRLESFFRTFMGNLRPLKHPKTLLIQTLLTLVIWSITIITEWLMFKVFHLNHLGLDAALAVVATLLIGMLAPAPPGFAGNFEAFVVAGLAIYRVDGSLALGYALMLHWIQFGLTFVLGMVFLRKEQISFRSLIEFAKDLKADLRT